MSETVVMEERVTLDDPAAITAETLILLLRRASAAVAFAVPPADVYRIAEPEDDG